MKSLKQRIEKLKKQKAGSLSFNAPMFEGGWKAGINNVLTELDKTKAVIKEEMKLYDGRYNRGLKFCLKALDNRTIKTIKQNSLSVKSPKRRSG